jgi:hypothetical protein
MTAKKSDNPNANVDTQATGSNVNQGKGAQAGGKTSPAGGPETFESDQTNKINQGGSQAGRSDPYPPVNPERPMMAGGQSRTNPSTSSSGPSKTGSNVGSSNVGSSGNVGGSSVGSSSYGSSTGSTTGQSGMGSSTPGSFGSNPTGSVGATAGAEEEE